MRSLRRRNLALAVVAALTLVIAFPVVGWAQFRTLPVPPVSGGGYDAAKQAEAMLVRHDVGPKLDAKLVEKLKTLREGELVPVVVQIKEKPDLKKLRVRFTKRNFTPAALEQHKANVIGALKAHAQRTQAEVLTVLKAAGEKGKARDVRSFWLFNGLTAKVTKDVIYELARQPQVEKISYDDIKFKPVASPALATQSGNLVSAGIAPAQASVAWGVYKIGADQVWQAYGYNGAGIVVGHLDTGVDPRHKDLLVDPNGDPNSTGNWKLVGWAEFDAYGNMISNDLQQAYDDDGHGTHTAGTILGGAASGTAIGVAPGARLVAGKVLTGGWGTLSQVLAGMEWIVTVPGVRVVNMSLGGAGTQPFMIEPTRNMVEMLIFPAFSIGNDGPGTSGSPGNVPAAFGVGATDAYDSVAFFSGGEWVQWSAYPYYGKYLKPDIAAPGVDVYSSVPGNGYATYSGTSMAAPHVSGAVALVLQAQPWLSVEEIKSLLRQTAVDLGSPGPDTRYGWGRLNVKAAVDLLQNAGFVSGSISGPAGEAVEADVFADGRWLAKADPVYGAYDLALARGGHELRVTHPLYRDATALVNVATNEVAEKNFSLEKKAVGWFAGTVKDASGQPVANAVVELEGVPGAATKTDSQGRYQLANVLEGSYKMRVTPPLPYGFIRLDVNIPSTGGRVEKNFTVSPADILLIDHDYFNYWENYYAEALAQKGYSAAYWDWDAADMYGYYDPLPWVETLKQFGKVILIDNDGFAIFRDEQSPYLRYLRQYLDTGRKMFVSGQDIGFMTSVFGDPNYAEFYQNYLHARYLDDHSGSFRLRGVPADGWPRGIFDGVNIDINWFGGDAANNQLWPDVVAPFDDQAVSVADYVDPLVAGSGALAVDGPLHRLMYFSFGFEGINGAGTRADVMDRVLKFLDSPTENTRETIKYSSAWSVANDVYATDGRYRISSIGGATATFTFTGDNIAWITAKGPAYGKAEVLIDGVSKGTFDLYNASQLWQQEIAFTGLAAGTHTITVKVLGQKNASSTGYGVVVDAFAVKVDDNAATYTGTWRTHNASYYYGGSARYSNQTSATFTFTFTGRGVAWRTNKGPDRGIARIYLDGVNKGIIDLYGTSYSWLNVMYTGLADTTHTLKVVVTGQKNPASSGTTVLVDAFAVYQEDNSASIKYSTVWYRHYGSGYSGGSADYSTSSGAKATYVFAGNSITWLTSTGPNRGIARVYIDGNDFGIVDLYAPAYQNRIPIDFRDLGHGLHTIEIVNTGTKNASSSGYAVLVDAFARGLNE